MEDLLEVIIGEIRDEHEPTATSPKTASAGTSSPEASTSTAWAIFSLVPREETSNPPPWRLVSECWARAKAGRWWIGMASA